MDKFTADTPNLFFDGMTTNEVNSSLKQVVDHIVLPAQSNCPYCHFPCKLFRNGDRLIPPNSTDNWWGLMPHYQENKIGTIMKHDTCPNCGRLLND